MAGLDSRFKAEEKNYMVKETLKEYALASVEAAYNNTGEHAFDG